MIDIKVYINKREVVQTSAVSEISVPDTAEVQIEITSAEHNYFNLKSVDILLEDYKVPYTKSEDGTSVKSLANNLFRESFGYSNLRLFIDDEQINELIFKVSTNEEKYKNIKDMMTYLLNNNKRILDLCLSRTKSKSKNDGRSDASFDSIISLAEQITQTFTEKGMGLKNELRHRLELIKEDASGNNFFNVNPYDVIDNLDKLSQGYSHDSITLLGKVYSMDGIKRENYINSYNLEENKILLGGLISIKEILLSILSAIMKDSDNLTLDEEYRVITPFGRSRNYVIEDLYTEITTSGMKKRINSILESIDELLYFFQKEIQVDFQGFHPPVLSSFARRSRFYLTAYEQLDKWYSLGSPNIGVDQSLAKIRSTSKIYELFTLYRLIDTLHMDGWDVINSVQHDIFKNFIPSQVDLRKDDTILNVFYEKKIGGFDKETKHNDLIALNKNNYTSQYNYYNPDFILVKNKLKTVSYFILDAKYSSSTTLRDKRVLDTLYEKYFCNLAVYNEVDEVLEKQAIKCVSAIHPFGKSTVTKWPSHLPKIIPDVSSVLLSQETNGLGKVLSLINDPL